VQPVDEPWFCHLRLPLKGTNDILHGDQSLWTSKRCPAWSFHASWNEHYQTYHELKHYANMRHGFIHTKKMMSSC
jgi:hypothetical protein